ncbi:SusC/RagA family TonB-linked outer membrane protein [Chitinophaga arvensicola]|uniref:TonB-linked outer membrane protein, SusC/RagA family n=1 Tax=Chitinophaga arvensicola TaxID=29529 RepID=A0A1I0NE01_9BACT|nr:SusC/RagA family TonB-linked outer membrane protein [Chitinophaga arvensicola]SEV99416.1 TonB-linked outer membrane protein, SusC/RagA family [Chitinophaga arvensicola]
MRICIRQSLCGFLYLCVLLLGSSRTVAQQKQTAGKRSSTITVKEALDKVTALYGTTFMYEGVLLKNKTTTVNVEAMKDKPVEDVLKSILYPGELLFLYVDKNHYTIVARQKKDMPASNLVPSSPAASGVSTVETDIRTVNGTVKDQSGSALPGVTIQLEGQKKWAITDNNGYFIITVPAETGTLLFSYSGMEVKKMTLGKSNTLQVVMENKVLSEVVVTGYQTLSKERATGAFSTVKAADLEKRRISSLSQVLEGTLPGVVSYKGSINVRGTSTFNATSAPLYVIDGFPVENTAFDDNGYLRDYVPNINPEDIENITVLKDAAAASIYGARAANGVIVITTKKAKSGPARVTFSGDFSLTPKYDLSYLNKADANEMVDLTYDYFDNDPAFKTAPLTEAARIRSGAGLVTPAMEYLLQVAEGKMTRADADAKLNVLRHQNIYNQQILDHLMRVKSNQQYNLSVAKATAGNAFNFSATFINQQGYDKKDVNKSLGLNLSNALTINKWLTATTGVYLNYGDVTRPGASGQGMSASDMINAALPFESIYDDQGNALPIRNRQTPDDKALYEKYKLFSYDKIPEQELNMNLIYTRSLKTRAYAKVNAKITSWLNYDVMFQYEKNSGKTEQLMDAASFYMRDKFNTFSALDTKGNTVYKLPVGNSLRNTSDYLRAYTFRNQLNFSKTFNEQHEVVAIAGSETREVKNNRDYMAMFGYDPLTMNYMPVNALELSNRFTGLNRKTTSLSPSELAYLQEVTNRYFSFYGNAAYTYNNKYMLNGSIRYDLSNLFGTNPTYQYRPLWSAGASWIMSREQFMEDISWLDILKLRASYGINGNVAKNAGPFMVASYGLSTLTGNTTGGISNPPNPNLRWEKTTTTNVGVDFSILKSRLSGSVDAYHKLSNDLLSSVTINPALGFTNAYVNNGAMLNTGIELMLKGQVIRQRDFDWSVTVNSSFNKNKVTRVDYSPKTTGELVNNVSGYFLQGDPYKSLYSFDFGGLNSKGDPQIYNQKGELTDKLISTPDVVHYSGTYVPKFSGALINDFRYKQFQFSFLFVYNAGHVMRMDVPYITSGFANIVMPAGNNNAWKKPGDELFTNVPRIAWDYDKNNNNYRNSYYQYGSQNIVSASYIKARNLAVSYSLPKSWLQRVKIADARIRLQADNLFYIGFNGQGIDPEATSLMGTGRTLPIMPTYNLGFNISL